MMHDIQQTLSDLLSLKSTSTQISDALSKLNASLTRLALGLADSSSGDAIEAASFIAAQDGFVQNGELQVFHLDMLRVLTACCQSQPD